jgi:hypothetical protein
VAARFADAAVHKSSAVDRALIPSDDARLRDVELNIVTTARHHEAQTMYLRQTVPGIGTMLRLVLLDDSHASERFPRGQDVLSSGRLVTWSKASAGNRDGPSGTTIGQAHRTWAFAEAAVLCLRDQAAAHKDLARLEHNHGQGQAVIVLAQKLARAVYSRLTRQVACERETFCPREPRREGRGGACSLTGHPGGAPHRGTHTCLTHGVGARQGA